jgi:phosphatidylethanolamine/phosphatidyl-N-methylethanolamine N-methyltransferase
MRKNVVQSQDSVIKIYDRWGRIYDIIFKRVFSEGRDVAVKMLDLKPGERLLEVGVGTGLSLPLYSRRADIVGIDISSKMLEQASEKIDKHNLRNVALQVMDAQKMDFPDNSFDCVTACYVVSAAPDPHKVVSEIRRVCKPGGRIVFINHFKSHNRVLAKFEELVNGFCQKFGWETTLDLDALLKSNNLQSEVTEKVNMFDYWRAVLCFNTKE